MFLGKNTRNFLRETFARFRSKFVLGNSIIYCYTVVKHFFSAKSRRLETVYDTYLRKITLPNDFSYWDKRCDYEKDSEIGNKTV